MCKFCKLKLDSMDRLQTHMKTDHARKYKCEYCDEEHDSRYHLELHLVSRHKEIKPINVNNVKQNFCLNGDWKNIRVYI